MVYKFVDRVHLAQDSYQWRALVSMVMNLRVGGCEMRYDQALPVAVTKS
jgi:hypothetical protein